MQKVPFLYWMYIKLGSFKSWSDRGIWFLADRVSIQQSFIHSFSMLSGFKLTTKKGEFRRILALGSRRTSKQRGWASSRASVAPAREKLRNANPTLHPFPSATLHIILQKNYVWWTPVAGQRELRRGDAARAKHGHLSTVLWRHGWSWLWWISQLVM